ncbi:hypothetical protein CO178_01980 [candidate division WWE3 bacterium CG_4_9_14_3_um_filter_34_6]|uniref:Glycosyltransferase family 2 protein n=1 Tax=candidate division WWE3 bacterium CG_4_9_14_3_um_filter_34_6 TaxID=1975079 RepID=A0A2M7X375_UNCKA|nr:MAG: hypothetical protein CO178_01980 [candidate division WWE3 bacterium CG_4_9_14_3_um_filter_34_6]
MKFVVITPTYNENENIKKTVEALQKVFKTMPSHEFHILVTDGNSPDGTANSVRELIKQDSNLHLLVEKEKRGLGAAYKDAMNFAFETMKADVVITFDADLSHDPKVIPSFVKYFEEGENYVCGTRYKKGGGIPKEWGIHRKLLSSLGNLYVRTIYFGSGLTDFTSGYKAFNKKVYDVIKDKIGSHGGYTFAISSNLECIRNGFKAVEVPYHFTEREFGKSKMGTEYFFKAFAFVTKARIADFINSRFGKVFIGGGAGALSQLIFYGLIFYPLIEVSNIFSLPTNIEVYGFILHPQFLLSQLLGIEVGVAVSFLINNHWAFGDKKLEGLMFFRRYIKNNFVVSGAILIQLFIGQVLILSFGFGLFRNYLYQIVGILFGLIWNFYFYKKIIWKVK